MSFDPKQYELEDVGVLEVLDATGADNMLGEDGKPVTIRVYGPGSKQGVKAMHLSGKQTQLRMTGLLRGKVSRNAAEEADQERVEKLVMITESISGNFPIPVAEVYANPKLCYISDQVDAFFNEKSNFSKTSLTT